MSDEINEQDELEDDEQGQDDEQQNPPADNKERPTELWVCTNTWAMVGPKNNERGIEFRRIAEDGRLLQPHYVFWKGFRKQRPYVGAVYSIQLEHKRKDDESVAFYPGTLKWQRLWHDDAQRQKWTALEWAMQAEYEHTKDAEKAKQKTVNEMLEALRPLRQAYHRAPAFGRAKIEVQLLTWLRKWDVDKDV